MHQIVGAASNSKLQQSPAVPSSPLQLSCVSGAIGGWLRDQDDDPTGAGIRAMVPVNLRPLEESWQLGSRFGLAPLLLLPVGIDNAGGVQFGLITDAVPPAADRHA